MDDLSPNLARLYLPLLANPQPPVRRQACMIMLGTYGNRALTYVRRLIDDADPQVRQEARLALLAVAEAAELSITLQPFRGMYVQCMGRLRVYMDSQELHTQSWGQADYGRAGWQKAQSVFAYMVHSGQRGASRAAIGAAVWGDSFRAGSLTRTLTTLQHALVKTCGAAFIDRSMVITEDYCMLDPHFYHTDVRLFEHTFETAARIEQEGGLAAAAPIYSQAFNLYAGPYMADVARGSGWGQTRRDYLTGSFIIAAERLAEHAFAQGQHKQCINICTAALDADETADEVVVWLLRAFAAEGRQAELEHAYRRYRRTLALDQGSGDERGDVVVQTYQELSHIWR